MKKKGLLVSIIIIFALLIVGKGFLFIYAASNPTIYAENSDSVAFSPSLLSPNKGNVGFCRTVYNDEFNLILQANGKYLINDKSVKCLTKPKSANLVIGEAQSEKYSYDFVAKPSVTIEVVNAQGEDSYFLVTYSCSVEKYSIHSKQIEDTIELDGTERFYSESK